MGSMSSSRRPALVAAALVSHVVVTTLVWRDLARRPARDVRGGRNLWRTLSALNTGGALAYVLLGRRR